ncbi:MAG: GNAT family N-acetyltransferase [Candidatus Thorarchaeota archaeon]
MSSIREVELNRRATVSEILNAKFLSLDDEFSSLILGRRTQSEYIEKFLDLWEEGKLIVLGKFAEEDILGIATLGLESNKVGVIHVQSPDVETDISYNYTIEKELFDKGFEILRKCEPWVTTGGSGWLSKTVVEHALQLGFKKYDMISMKADREKLETIKVPETPSEYGLKLYDVKLNDEVARLFYDSFQDSPDRVAEPDTLSSGERSKSFVSKVVNNQYGDFNEGAYSWILTHNDKIVGVNMRSTYGNIGFGIGMCLKPSYRGKGLGRLLFTHSIFHMLHTAPQIEEMHLETSSINPARNLYSSVGFTITSTHSRITWNKD